MKRLLATVVLIFLLPQASYAQQTERDALTAFLEDNLSGNGRKVTVTGFSGAFSSQAQIEQLTIADDTGVWITLNGITLDWSRASLLRGAVDINVLKADEVIVARPPVASDSLPAAEATGFALPELPVSINVGSLAAERIVLGAAFLGTEVVGTLKASASLSDGAGKAQLSLVRLDDATQGQIDLFAEYANTDQNIVIDLLAEEGADGIAARMLGLPGTPATRLSIKGNGPLTDFEAAIQLQTNGEDRLAGSVTLTGQEAGESAFSADIGGDLAPLFLPEYAEFFGPRIALRASGTRSPSGSIDLQALTLQARALRLDGAAVIAGDGLPQRLVLTGRMELPDGAPVLLPLSGDIQTRVSSADVDLRFDAARGEGWNASAVMTGLEREDIAMGRLALQGSGRIARQGQRSVLGGTVRFAAADVRPADAGLASALGDDVSGSLLFDWREGGTGLRIGKLELRGGGYIASVTGRIGDLTGGFRVAGRMTATHRNLQSLSALSQRALGGVVSVTATGEGSPLGGDFDIQAEVTADDLTVDQPELDALLRGRASISLAANRDATGTTIRRLELRADQLIASATARLTSGQNQIAAKLQFADISRLGPDYGGALTAETQLTGTMEDGNLTLDGIGTDLKTGQALLDRGLKGPTRLSADVAFANGRYDVALATLKNALIDASLRGYYEKTTSDLAATVNLADLSILGSGYRGAIRAQMTASGSVDAGSLTLAADGRNLAIGQQQADRLLAGNSRIAASLGIRDGVLQIDSARLTSPQITASATGSVTEKLRQVVLEARLTNMALLVPDLPGPLTVTGRAQEDGSGFSVDMNGTGPGGVEARVNGRLARGLRTANLSITGRGRAELINAFLSDRSVTGQLDYALQLDGPIALSSLSGNVRLSDGRLADNSLPFSLEALTGAVALRGGTGALTLSGNASSGGRLDVGGTVTLAPPFNANLEIDLNRIVAKDPALYETDLSGKLRLVGPITNNGLLSGAITLRDTELHVPSTGLGGVGSVPGLRHVNEPARVRTTRQRAGLINESGTTAARSGGGLRLDLLVEAPSRIFIRGRGIDAELGGRIILRGTTRNIVPSGQFSLVRGRIDILGKRLDLREADLLLQGDLVPSINIVASNESDGVTSSVNVTGKANDPVVTFSSRPELPQEEVLSHLLFSNGLDKISALQAAQLASAVATLAGRGGDGIVGNLRKNFGLDDLDLATDADGNTSLKAGKYISRNAYTEIEVDQQGRSKINLNLDIKKGVTVRGSVGGAGTAGIGIFVEKDY